jgi:hypothetical protein
MIFHKNEVDATRQLITFERHIANLDMEDSIMGNKRSSKGRLNAKGKSKIIGQLEQLAFVGHAVAVLEEAQLRAQNWANDKNHELNNAVDHLQLRTKSLRHKVRGAEKNLRDDAQERLERFVSGVTALPAVESLGDLPDRLVEELDLILDRVGLVRKDRIHLKVTKTKSAKARTKATTQKKAKTVAKKKPVAKKKAKKKATVKKAPTTKKASTKKKAVAKKAKSSKAPAAKKSRAKK